jgi:hypothetical protein
VHFTLFKEIAMIPKEAQKVYCTGCIHALKLCPIADGIVCDYCEMGSKMPSNFNILVVNVRYPNIDQVIKYFRVDPLGIDYLQRKKLMAVNLEASQTVKNRRHVAVSQQIFM